MENLNKVQKIILISFCVIMVLVIVYYFMQKTKQYDTLEVNEFVQNSEEATEETIITEEQEIIVVHITGEVKKEGIVSVNKGARITDVIEKSGGTTVDADLSKVNLAYVVSDAEKIYIPSIHDKEEQEIVSNGSGEGVIINNNILGQIGIVNINKATQTELETLTGIRSIYCTKDY